MGSELSDQRAEVLKHLIRQGRHKLGRPGDVGWSLVVGVWSVVQGSVHSEVGIDLDRESITVRNIIFAMKQWWQTHTHTPTHLLRIHQGLRGGAFTCKQDPVLCRFWWGFSCLCSSFGAQSRLKIRSGWSISLGDFKGKTCAEVVYSDTCEQN